MTTEAGRPKKTANKIKEERRERKRKTDKKNSQKPTLLKYTEVKKKKNLEEIEIPKDL